MTANELRPLGKYMTVEPLGDGEDGDPQWLIANKRSGDPLARIVYYAPWRQYITEPAGSGIVFNNQCLRDIAGLLDTMNAERKGGRND